MLPDWSPGLHPLVVHFPIALLVVAALADALALAWRHPAARHAATALYVLGALGALGAYLTGQAAEEAVRVAPDVLARLNAHADWGQRLLGFASVYALARVALAAWGADRRWPVHAALALVGLIGPFLVYQTAERGAELVYRHGVGVAAVAEQAAATPTAGVPLDLSGAWVWTPEAGPLPENLAALAGAVSPEARAGRLVAVPGQPLFLVLGPSIEGVVAEATLDLAGFAGTVRLAHHVRSTDVYDFFEVEHAAGSPAMLRLGRVESGRETVFDDDALPVPDDLLVLEVSGVGTHFRGLVGGAMRTHGHGAAAPPGRVGLRLDGEGTVGLLRLAATPVQP